ncbi:MAG: hydantoinase B/oxoprolinase family protein [Gammaproteobacteria bacterium]|nr:hydantoinase B/oxoprolinase family protein [Gammaproteobacteria bacterium]
MDSKTPFQAWHFWIDRGGTFTDVIGQRPDGGLVAIKLLSRDPARYPDAATEGIRRLLGRKPASELAGRSLGSVRMGTTVATNALLERRGEPVLLVTTSGLGDALRIGQQHRPELFARHIRLPGSLYTAVIEARERLDARGGVVRALDREALRAALAEHAAAGLRAVAVVFMHAWRNPEHELAAGRLAREAGFTQVSLSHQASPLMKLVARGDTALVDAYLSPVLQKYVETVAGAVGDTPLYFMQSNGGLTSAANFSGRDSILSGPAGGVVGAIRVAAQAGLERVIGFDMGGTSTDVFHYAGELERSEECEIAGVRLRTPMMRIHTVAAGGGSRLHFEHGRFLVGPDSAGADPGPACYRRGGPLTLTDANLLLGRLLAGEFPKIFGAGGDQPLDTEVVGRKFTALALEVSAATGRAHSADQVALGFLEVAVQNMARAIKRISVQRGHDVSSHTLCAFGGAGGQHACRVADALGIDRVLLHPHAGVLSALGIGLADRRAIRQAAVERPLDAERVDGLRPRLDELAADAIGELQTAQAEGPPLILERAALRYAGTDSALPVPFGNCRDMQDQFEARHRGEFGFAFPGRAIVLESLTVEAVLASPLSLDPAPAPGQPGAPLRETRMLTAGGARQAAVYVREELAIAQAVPGPAIITEPNSTIVVEPGWQAERKADGNLHLQRHLPREQSTVGTRCDPVMLEIFNQLYMSIAEQMGAALAHTAHSVNIKERLDFSCAVFDGDGGLVANAPHMPVHLGSMGETVRYLVRARQGRLRPGQVLVHNAPYAGGTHLPDITVVTPVFVPEDQSAPLFFVASRGHHADLGGITPGSMPPHSRRIEEEGILFDNVLLVEDGNFREQAIRDLLGGGPWPARNPEDNLADLRAQVAANTRGVRELERMLAHYGVDTVRAYMGHVQDNAAEMVRQVIDRLHDGQFEAALDEGARIRVALRVDRERRSAVVDFTGTSAQRDSNFNAPSAIARAAVLYVFRTLVDADIPLNAGCLRPIQLILPAGSLLDPRPPAAVVAGNVETSQVLVDALFGALGILAASQGTMNNFTFGDGTRQYYETLCGGTGAGPDHPGTSAVHSHMTNSRLTDPEVLEWRFPVRVESFTVRQGSGGAGRFAGGDGVRREIRFLEAMQASILSGRRTTRPFGLAGGEPGKSGRNFVLRANGAREELGACATVALEAGDRFVIETPGGGGFGPANEGDEPPGAAPRYDQPS